MIARRKPLYNNEHAITGLEIVILLVAGMLILGYLGYGELSHGKTPARARSQTRNKA